MGMMTAVVQVGKQGLSWLPNIEVVSLLFIIYTMTLGWKVLFVVYAFVLLQGALYGPGVWFIMYLYVWTILVIVTMLLRHWDNVIVFTLVSGIYGLIFGALCTIPYFFIGGVSMAFTWWVAGIPYDIIHAIGNATVCFVAYRPLRVVFKQIKRITAM